MEEKSGQHRAIPQALSPTILDLSPTDLDVSPTDLDVSPTDLDLL
jgi:hypothetical protein